MSSTERPHWIDVGGGAVERAEAAALGNGVDRGFRGVVGVCPLGLEGPQWAARRPIPDAARPAVGRLAVHDCPGRVPEPGSRVRRRSCRRSCPNSRELDRRL